MKDTAKEFVRRIVVETAVVMASGVLIKGITTAFNRLVEKRQQKKNNTR